MLSSHRQQGFSLIELMIGMVAGLIVIGAVSSFTVASLRASNENIQSSRLTQDLRTAMTLVSRELRRAGYDAAAVTRMGLGSGLSNFTELSVSTGCIGYEYNRQSGNEFRAIRLNNGALEMATATAAIAGCGAGTWNVMTDPDVVTITSFVPTQTLETFSSVVSVSVVGGNTEVTAGCGQVRNIAIDMAGTLVADANVARSMHEEVRVRADPLRFLKRTYPGISAPGAPVPSSAERTQLLADCESLL